MKHILYVIYVFPFDIQVKLREMKPGMLSQELKEVLGMPDGAPPPWLINMQVSEETFMIFKCSLTLVIWHVFMFNQLLFFFQRYGPPPSYPHLKIPGLNAPIPPGASFGYHPGGWGKPPVDEVSFFECFAFSLLLLL